MRTSLCQLQNIYFGLVPSLGKMSVFPNILILNFHFPKLMYCVAQVYPCVFPKYSQAVVPVSPKLAVHFLTSGKIFRSNHPNSLKCIFIHTASFPKK